MSKISMNIRTSQYPGQEERLEVEIGDPTRTKTVAVIREMTEFAKKVFPDLDEKDILVDDDPIRLTFRIDIPRPWCDNEGND